MDYWNYWSTWIYVGRHKKNLQLIVVHFSRHCTIEEVDVPRSIFNQEVHITIALNPQYKMVDWLDIFRIEYAIKHSYVHN